MVECFTERYIRYSEYSNMWSFEPWIRITDGSKVYELRPAAYMSIRPLTNL